MAERQAGGPEGAPLSSLLDKARRRLADGGVADAALDARLLVEHFTATRRIDAISRPDQLIGPAAVAALDVAIERRLAGEPVHRILGFREFYGLELGLSADTLEPRPDTEILVDLVLDRLRAIVAARGGCRILDLGTGTGAIALAVLAEIPQAVATGVDIAPGAVAAATSNAARLGLAERFEALQSDWFEKISGRYDAILSNPPYITHEEMAELMPEVSGFDPHRALDGGPDGLDAYRLIAAQSGEFLAPEGLVGVEIGHRQKMQVIEIFAGLGFRHVDAAVDLAGRDRALMFEM
ncbi:peptide chain release factor N(5)-glutamine methyltransferase [Mesorhizobium xinjiangense]|uniref:peptide chain release factor N(5)-glutamine methyltransferase n=1 Tax=Mesorhizobium xinjiangense TaxID=2678685 RepID=UPI0012ED2224|nr:peptide chain release factor N(5)-glutamine methyltransferase [Mesorhizobium xinjiangense]